MNLKEQLEIALAIYIKDPPDDLKNLIKSMIDDLGEQSKSMENMMIELQSLKQEKDRLNELIKCKDMSIQELKAKIVEHEMIASKIDSIVASDDKDLQNFIKERDASVAQNVKYLDIQGSLMQQVHQKVIDGYVKACNNLCLTNMALSRQVMNYQQKSKNKALSLQHDQF